MGEAALEAILRDPIVVNTSNGYPWLECFADDMDDEHGDPIIELDGGLQLAQVLAAVDKHRQEHGCATWPGKKDAG